MTKRKVLIKFILVLIILTVSAGFSSAQLCGDVNDDGSVNIIDALLLAQHYVGLEVEGNFIISVSDVNNDNRINIIDGLMVAQYYVNLISELNCPVPSPTSTPEPTVPVHIIDPNSAVGEIEIIQEDAGYWKNVKYGKPFFNPIVILGIPTYKGEQPLSVRVRNVNNYSFDFQLDEWNYLDGSHIEEIVDFLVYEEGCHTFSGVNIEAGKVSVDENWVTVNIQHTFSSPPVVLAQCVTFNDYSAVTTRIRNVTTNSFEVRLQEEEGSTDGGNHKYEDVHYILYEQHEYAFIVDDVMDTWKKLPFHNGGAYVTSYLFGSIQTMEGPDTCALRHTMNEYGYNEIMIEEEISSDEEIGHPNGEKVGILQLFLVNPGMLPDDLTVKLTLRDDPGYIQFTRQIKFVNQDNIAKTLTVEFNRYLGMEYTGSISATSLNYLQSMVIPNNRSYWDEMHFINSGDFNFVLDIDKMEIWIYYDRNSAWDGNIKIASEADKILQPGASLELDNSKGRIEYVNEYLNTLGLSESWTSDEYNALAPPIKAVIADLGKSGSSDESDSKEVNPKYGLEILNGAYYCGQFISWYYYEAGYKLYGDMVYDFLSPGMVPGEMGDWFREAGRRYDYDSDKFCFLNEDNTLDMERTTIPKPGDYFGRYKEHAMMLLHWDDVNKIAYVIDGPYPAGIRKVDVPAGEANGKIFFIGRIPDNDDRILDKRTFIQNGSNDWKSVTYGKYFYDPIVIMGIPSYNDTNDNDPVTMRVQNVTRSGFRFQLDEWNYLDGAHSEETVDYLVYEKGCHTYFGSNIEAGKMLSVDDNWVTVNIQHAFSSPPVVLAQCVTRNGSAAVTTRISNVTNTSFDLRLQEEEGSPDAGYHNPEEVHYILYEQNQYAFIVNDVTALWKALPEPPSPPIGAYIVSYIFGSIQTMEGPDPCAIRQKMSKTGYYDIIIEEETSLDAETAHPFGEQVGILRLFSGIIH